MTLPRRVLLGALAAPAIARAQGGPPGAWPQRPITLIVPYPPGGSSDNVARPIQQPLAALLGQNVVIENRGGAGGPTATPCWSGRPPS